MKLTLETLNAVLREKGASHFVSQYKEEPSFFSGVPTLRFRINGRTLCIEFIKNSENINNVEFIANEIIKFLPSMPEKGDNCF